MKRFPGVVLASLTLAACTSTPTATPPVAITKVDPSAPPLVAAITDCGTFKLSQGEPLPRSAAACFVDAVRAGRPARLKVTSPSTEGDPIPVTYTAAPDGRVEVITDYRQDGFGAKVIMRQTCTGPRVAEVHPAFAECSEPTPIQSVIQ